METTVLNLNRQAIAFHPSTTLKFRKPILADSPLLDAFFQRHPSRSCDYTVGGILLWVEYFDYKFCIFQDTLFLQGRDSNGIFFHQPIGGLEKGEAELLLNEYCNAYGIPMRIITPGECKSEDVDTFIATHDNYLPGWREYLYNIDQFLHFSGKKMEKKRNHLNYFMNHYADYEMEILDASKSRELIEFNDKFNLYHKEGETFDYESHAISEAISNYESYPFFGLLIRYKGNIIGYTFGERSGDTFIIHAEKGDIEYRGVYQALSSLLSRAVQEKYPDVKYLNREDDMDNDYLRQSKLSYHPTKFITKWDISA